jgi:hypothetical protein
VDRLLQGFSGLDGLMDSMDAEASQIPNDQELLETDSGGKRNRKKD